jgi:hypothetical protein
MFRSICVIVMIGVSSMCAAQSSPPCKAVEHYGVKGCELLPDRTCPAGYHQQAVDPPNPMMKGPTYLMCVPDKAQPKEQKPQQEQKPQETPPGAHR